MKILNLYAGIGGNRKLWGDEHDITAVENDPFVMDIYKEDFPNDTFIIGDAHQYLLDHYEEFDFIWSSPPCPSHSKARFARHKSTTTIYPDLSLYQEIIFLKSYFKGKYAVENVIPYYEPLINATKVGRHLYWTNFKVGSYDIDGRDITNHLACDRYMGKQSKVKIARNGVEPKLGLYILNCAMDIITKQNVKQSNLFE